MLRGDRVKQLRLKAGYTHEDFAEHLKVGTRMIARYEAGDNDPSADIVSRMAKIFNVSSDYLLGLTDNPNVNIIESDLDTKERTVIAALRRGDDLEAIKAIVG